MNVSFETAERHSGTGAFDLNFKLQLNWNSNFDLISSAITNAIMNLSITYKKPIGNSIITLFNKNQAFKRYNKGKEAANAIIEVLKIK